jgi:hypothetical protein
VTSDPRLPGRCAVTGLDRAVDVVGRLATINSARIDLDLDDHNHLISLE